MATYWNNKKKDWFSHETSLVFVHGNVFKDRSRNSATFKMELFATIGNIKVYNQWAVVFACCCGNSAFCTRLKLDENDRAFKAASNTISCSVDMFLHFFWEH